MGLARPKNLLSAVALGAALFAGGCADAQETLIITNALSLGTDCVADPGAAILTTGTLDTSFGTGMVVGLALVNRQPPGATDNSGLDSSEIHTRDVQVSLSMPQAPQVIDNLRAQNGAFVEFTLPIQSYSLQGEQTVGIIVEVLTPPATIALDDALNGAFEPGSQVYLVADIVVTAERTGNTAGNVGVIESREFTFPVRVCSGCLIDCSTCPGGACPADDLTYAGGVCGNAQDSPLVPSTCADDQGP
jgi:hypothetical protein